MKQIFTLIVLCFTLIKFSEASTLSSTSTYNPEYAKGPIKNLISWFQATKPLVVTATNDTISCIKSGTGRVTITGGTSPYVIVSFMDASSTLLKKDTINVVSGNPAVQDSIENLTAGSYSVLVENSSNSGTYASFNIISEQLIITGYSKTNITCNGNNDGSIKINHAGGKSPFSFGISNSKIQSSFVYSYNSDSIPNLGAGSYYYSILDNNGCYTISSQPIKITEPTLLTLSLLSQADAKGCNNGSVKLSASGGTASYTYYLSSPTNKLSNTTGDFSKIVPPDTYTDSVVDNNGCNTSTGLITISQTVIPVFDTLSITSTPVKCKGDLTGSITITITGGSPNYTYVLTGPTPKSVTNPTTATQLFSGLLAGTYTLKVTDGNGCSISKTVKVSEPAAALTLNLSEKDVTVCFGNANGKITAVANGGTSATGNYTFALTPNDVVGIQAPAGTMIYDGLTAKAFNVVVTDDNSCTVSKNITVNAPVGTPLNAIAATVKTTCSYTADGKATLSATGGNAGFIPANTYSFAVANQGAAQPSTFPLTAATYTYPPKVGGYAVWVKDGQGCIDSTNFTIKEQDTVLVTANFKPVVGCSGANTGEIQTLTVTGGTPKAAGLAGYGYTLTPALNTSGDVSGDYTALVKDKYTLTAIDKNGCKGTITDSITEPEPIVITPPTITPTTCHGTATGTITVIAHGGKTGSTLSYSIRQLPLIPYNLGKFSGVPTGTYSIIVTDGSCTDSVTNVKVADAPLLVLTPGTVTNVACFGGSTGTIAATATGGTGAYTFSISPNVGTQDVPFTKFSKLPVNTTPGYVITVVDGNLCTKSSVAIKVTQPAKGISFKSIVRNNIITCPGDTTGSIVVTAQDGTSPYTFTLSPKAVTSTGNPSVTFKNLGARNDYAIHLVDAAGCAAPADSIGIILTEPAAIVVDTVAGSVKSPLCNGAANGSITFTAKQSGVLVPGTFTLTGLITAAQTKISPTGSAVFSSLAADTYTVSFKSTAKGCAGSDVIILAQPAKIVITTLPTTSTTCHGSADGTIPVTATGGKTGSTLTYSIRQLPLIPYNLGKFSGVPTGTYSIIVTDGSCTDSVTNVKVADAPLLVLTPGTVTNVACFGGSTGTIAATATGGTGAYTFSISPNVGTQDVPFTKFSKLPANTTPGYVITVVDGNLCTKSSVAIKVTQPAKGINFKSIVRNNVLTCPGDTTGSIVVTAQDGTSPYTFTLSPKAVTSTGNPSVTFKNLGARNDYAIHLVDAAGCAAPADSIGIILTEPAAIILNPTVTPPTCSGGTTGSILVTAKKSGIDEPGTFTLTNAGKTLTLSNATGSFTALKADTYSIDFVATANSCKKTISGIIIIDATPVVITKVTTDSVKCKGGITGAIHVTATGTGALSYYLDGVLQPSKDIIGLSAKSYTVTVQDANSCASAAKVILVGEPLSALQITSATHTDILCAAEPNSGTVNVTAKGGTGTISYTLTPAGTKNTSGNFTGLSVNNYSVTVTDERGCLPTIPVGTLNVVSSVPAFDFSYTAKQPQCNGSGARITFTTIGGTAPFEYSYDGGLTYHNQNDSVGIAAGTYVLQARMKGHLCVTNSQSITITNPQSVKLTVTPKDITTCFGQNTGEIAVSATGGTNPYKYTIANDTTNAFITLPAPPNQKFTPLFAGNYKVWVKDNNGCFDSITTKISQPAQIIISHTTTQIDASNPTGSITITNIKNAIGATSYLVYRSGTTPGAFDNGVLPKTYSGLTAGTYYVEAHAGTCVEVDTVLIYNAMDVAVTQSAIINCKNDKSGTITLTPKDGTAPYTYKLYQAGIELKSSLPQNSKTPYTFNGLKAGTYKVSVSDNSTPQLYFEQDNIILLDNDSIKFTIGQIKDVSCDLVTLGSITVNSPTGGNGSYHYFIDGAEASNPFTNLLQATHQVMIFDDNGCKSDTTFVVVGSQSAINLNLTLLSPDDGTPSGAFTANASNGSTPYEFQLSTSPTWVTNATGIQPYSGLPYGDYTVTTRDANKCIATKTITIPNTYNTLNVSIAKTNNKCSADNTGSITLTIKDGLAPYVVKVVNESTTATMPATAPGNTLYENLGNGSYIITVSDATIPVKTSSYRITIGDDANLSFSLSSTTPICYSDSVATLTASGINAISYSINPVYPQTTPGVFNNLPLGNTYTITANAANGCILNQPITLAARPARILVTAIGNDATKTITASVTSPVGIYDFKLVPDGAGFTPISTWSGLTTGTPYKVYAQNTAGCIDSAAIVTLKNAGPIVIITDSVCGNDSTGTANVSINFGKPLYSYALQYSLTKSGTYSIYKNKSFINKNQTLTNLKAGYYVISIRSGDPIDKTDTFYIHSKKIIVTPTADGDNMSIKIHADGGSNPYTYKLKYIPLNMSTPFGTDSVFNKLIKGDYMAYATDKAGCTDSALIRLEPTKLKVVVTADTVCRGNKGNAHFAITNGAVPYIFKVWQPKDTMVNTLLYRQDTTLTNLNAGLYHYRLYDAVNDLERIDSFTIVETKIIIDTVFDSKAMLLTINASGGKAPYQYSLDGKVWSNTNAFAVKMQTYNLHVLDSRGCTDSLAVNLKGVLNVKYVLVKDTICKKDLDGDVIITALGSPDYTLSFTYNTDTPVEGITFADEGFEFPNMIEGTYKFHIEDAAGRSNDTTINIVASNLAINTPVADARTKSIMIHATGGSTPYVYGLDNWSILNTPPTDSLFTNLVNPSYLTHVMDKYGCRDSVEVSLVNPHLDVDIIMVKDTICLNSEDGEFIVQPRQGKSSYTMTINKDGLPYKGIYSTEFEVSDTVRNVPVGAYHIIVADTAGYVFDSVVNIVAIKPQVQFEQTEVVGTHCGNDSTGKLRIKVWGGIPRSSGLYFYKWDADLLVETQDTLNSLITDTVTLDKVPSRDHILTVNDSICTYSQTFNIPSELPSIDITKDWLLSDTALCIKPGSLTITASGGAPDNTKKKRYSYRWGKVIEQISETHYLYEPLSTTEYNDSVALNLKPGGYFVWVTDTNKCTTNNYEPFEVLQRNDMKLDIKAYRLDERFSSFTGNDTICYGDRFALKLQSLAGIDTIKTVSYDWLWSSAAKPTVIYQSSSQDSLVSIATNDAPKYRVFAKMTDSDICRVDSSVYIHAYPNPLILLAKDTTLGKDELPYRFSAPVDTTIIGGSYEYSWNAKDAETGTEIAVLDNLQIKQPTFTLKDATAQSYLISVLVNYGMIREGVGQCSILATTILNLTGGVDPQHVGNNILTPNDDGKNDFWYIRNAEYYPSINVEVFNRWGQKVFSQKGYDNQGKVWRGNYNGGRLPSGVYYYVIKLNDHTQALTGTVTILR